MQVLRSLAAALAAALLAAPAAAAAPAQDAERPARVSPVVPPAPGGVPPAGADGAERLALHAFALHHRRAGDALEVVRPLLSPLGTVELQPGRNTVVVRDSLAALSRIVPELRRFDRPLEPLELEVLVVRALAAGDVPAAPPAGAGPAVPADLERQLRALLRYERYELVAEASLRSRENEEVTYELGGGLSIRFRLGSLAEGRRIRLTDFQVAREAAGGARPLIHTNLNLWLDRPVTLGLARSESSASALMVAITCRRGGAKPEAAPARPLRRAAAGAEPD
jgi:hypothetical protein